MSTEMSEPYLAPGLAAPRPASDGLDEPYWNGTRAEELWVQRCPSCGAYQWGPEWMCHRCQAFDPDWVQVEPRGRIFSWQRPHHPVHPALAEQGPYIVVLVELPDADNIRIIADGVEIPRDPGRTSGWDWIDDTTIEVFGAPCESILAGNFGEIGAEFGCPPIIVN